MGHVGNGLHVTGFAWSPAYLLDCEHPVIFEAGFYCMGKLYVRDIINVIDSKRPSYLFLTHVHYDHCGAAQYLKNVFQGIKVAASERASKIMERENAVKLMGSLSKNVLEIISGMEGIEKDMLISDPFQPFALDRLVFDGDNIPVEDDVNIEVIATPGHTRDMMSFYIPQRKVLISTESCGVMGQTNQIVTEFLVDYDKYLLSLKRLAQLDVDIFCQGHHFVFTGDDVKRFFKNSIEAAEYFRIRVEELLLQEDCSVDRVVEIVKKEEYDTNPGPKQPEKAYLINLRTRVTHLAEKLKK